MNPQYHYYLHQELNQGKTLCWIDAYLAIKEENALGMARFNHYGKAISFKYLGTTANEGNIHTETGYTNL